MGRAIANTLAASGVAVVVTDKQPAGVLNRRQEVLGVADDGWRGVDSLVEEITSSGGSAVSLLGDISVAEDARQMVDEAAAWRGRLDILVNGAAAPQGLDRQDIEDVPIEVWDFVIRVQGRGARVHPGAIGRCGAVGDHRQRDRAGDGRDLTLDAVR